MSAFTKEGLAYISHETDEEMKGSRVKIGDVLLNITGASIGRACVVPNQICPANVNQHVCIIRCDKQLDAEFLVVILSTPKFQSIINESQAGGTRQALTKAMIEDFEVPSLPTDEQRQIAARLKAQLTEVGTARQAAQARAQDITLLRTRILNDVFATLGGAPLKVLGDYAPTTSGTTPPRGNTRYWEPAEVPWVKTGEVAFAPITETEEAISKAALAECSLTLLPPKTVLVAMYGQGKTRGQSAMLEIPATTNQACFAILPNSTWEPEFLYYWLVANYQGLRDRSEDRGGNQANLNGLLLRMLEIPAPDKPEQQRVVQHVRVAIKETDSLDLASKAMLADLDQLRQRLLAQAFQN